MEQAPTPAKKTPREAGSLGGRATRERHGEQHFRDIGKKGGDTVRRLMAAGRAALATEANDGE